MFNLEKFGFKAAPKAETNSVEPQQTDDATMEILQSRIKEVIAQSPQYAGTVNDFDVAQIARYMAIAQEKAGEPFTSEVIENSGDDFNEHLLASIEDRLAAKPSPDRVPHHAVNEKGVVIGHPDTKREIAGLAEDQHAA